MQAIFQQNHQNDMFVLNLFQPYFSAKLLALCPQKAGAFDFGMQSSWWLLILRVFAKK